MAHLRVQEYLDDVSELDIPSSQTEWYNVDVASLLNGSKVLGHEVDPLHLQIGGPEDTFYHVSIEASLGDCIDQIQMLLPVRSIDPVVRYLAEATMVSQTEEDIDEHEEYVRQHWNPLFDNLPVKVVAQWQGIPVMTRDVSALKEGDIIPLEPERLREVRVSMAGKSKYICRLGSLDNKCAVEILGRIIK